MPAFSSMVSATFAPSAFLVMAFHAALSRVTVPKVYYVGSNGLEDMKAELKDGILSWTAKHFSDYVVVSGEQKILVKESDGSLEYYGTLTDAITNAGENAVITLLADIPDAVGISVPSGKKFVLDFNQHTYTLTGPGAGSPNTESNAFQLLKDSTITFKNGTPAKAENAQSFLQFDRHGDVLDNFFKNFFSSRTTSTSFSSFFFAI